MSDLISRQAAIDVVRKYNFDFPQYMERFVTELRDAMKADLKHDIEALPTAQPTQSNDSNTLNALDCISRQAAIDAECEVCQIAPKKERGHNCTYYVHGCKEIECLRALPSTQPEQHYCRECKWSRCHINVNKGGNTESYWHCFNWGGGTDEEGDCYKWERRTDE